MGSIYDWKTVLSAFAPQGLGLMINDKGVKFSQKGPQEKKIFLRTFCNSSRMERKNPQPFRFQKCPSSKFKL